MMELRTTFNIAPADNKITYGKPVMFIGSCFAGAIGSKLEAGRMPVMINPSGTVYNPASVINTLAQVTEGREYREKDLFNYNGTWLSFNHYTDFSSSDRQEVLEKINLKIREAAQLLSKAGFLFVTFGTARIYRWKETGRIVSNCHKIPDTQFTRELLTVGEIVTMWNRQLDKLASLYPSLKTVFTISPVRHWKDGPHGNQVSKSTLFLAVEKLLEHPSGPQYFPAYELVMDDLRDYRFYAADMLHLSDAAVEYIWGAFQQCYFDKTTAETWQEAEKIILAAAHRLRSGNKKDIKAFAETMIRKIDAVSARQPGPDLESERKYFRELAGF